MPTTVTPAKYLHEHLSGAELPDLTLSDDETTLTCPQGPIVEKQGKNWQLHFWYYDANKEQYIHRDQYKTLVFPSDFDVRNYLYLRNGGYYTLSFERQVKRILNPEEKDVEVIKLVSSKDFKRFFGKNLTLSINVFLEVLGECRRIFDKKKSYGNSTENYLLNLAATKYSKYTKKAVTYIQPGEMTFLVDRINLKTKKSKKDFAKFLNDNDVSSLEDLLDKLLKYQAFSDGFLRRLNDYFIKEHLKEVIEIGKKILALRRADLSTDAAKEILARLEIESVSQLETLWQRYFERYLLYLIFSYKQIFPKVQLTDIQGTKKYPDFIGVNHYNGLDVIEIKTHLTKVLQWDNSHQNFYFSAEMSKAIVQTSNYLDSITKERFKDTNDRRKITNFIDEENLYHPRGIIIISSKKNLTTKRGKGAELERDFTKLRNGLLNIQILTFDEVLDIPDDYITNIADNVS